MLSESLRLDAPGNDTEKIVGCQTGAADEAAIDVGGGHEFGGVGGLDAAPVQDANGLGGGGTEGGGELAADVGVGFGGLLGGRVAAGADGPDGFVGDDETGELIGLEAGEAGVDLLGEDVVGLVGVALGEGFADAEYRTQAGGDGGFYFS